MISVSVELNTKNNISLNHHDPIIDLVKKRFTGAPTWTRSSGTCLLFSSTLIGGMIQSLFILTNPLFNFLQGWRDRRGSLFSLCDSAKLQTCGESNRSIKTHH